MTLKCLVVDKTNKILSDKELERKIIDNSMYYNIVLPIRKRINDEIFDKERK